MGNPTKAERKALRKLEAQRKAEEANSASVAVLEAETPETAEETPAETPEETPTPAEEELSGEDKAIYDAISAMEDGEARTKALERFAKLKASDDKSGQAKRFAEFDTSLREKLPEYLAELAKAHNVSLVGRKITIAYPKDGSEVKTTHTPLSTRTNGGGGSTPGKGFTSHGKVVLDGVEHNSLHALADVLGLQYEGRRTAFQVFEEPLEKGSKNPLPYKFSVTKQDDGRLLVEKSS